MLKRPKSGKTAYKTQQYSLIVYFTINVSLEYAKKMNF